MDLVKDSLPVNSLKLNHDCPLYIETEIKITYLKRKDIPNKNNDIINGDFIFDKSE